MARKRADTAEVAKRIEEILRIRLDGAQFHDVVQFSAEKGWDLKERQIRKYIQRADDLLVERMEKKRRRIVAQHLARRESLYARAVNAADFRTGLAILSDLAKLQNLYVDASDLKELAKLAAQQGERVRELEARLDATRQDQEPTTPTGPAARPPVG